MPEDLIKCILSYSYLCLADDSYHGRNIIVYISKEELDKFYEDNTNLEVEISSISPM